MGATLSVIGLALDIVGAVILSGGILLVAAADYRQRNGPPPISYRNPFTKAAVCFALCYGSPKAEKIGGTVKDMLVSSFWGLIALFFGFLLQGAGVIVTIWGSAR